MTRITNFGRKRTYLEAGFEKVNVEEGEHIDTPIADAPKSEGTVDTLPKKKSRKRRKSGKASAPRDEGVDVEETHVDVNVNNSIPTKKATSGGKRKREEERHAKAAASESRRIKRKKEREASITCLACRKKGHIVKDCPQARTALLENDEGSAGAPGRSVVGVCYRCGSTKHSLSRCKKPTNPKKPLPFASCFVCSGKGHLASSCPKNQGKGIYPNGGSCKLCGQTSHLAKDCELRSNEIASRSAIMLGGTHTEGGADEDDFHVLKRRRDAVQKEETLFQKLVDRPLESVPPPKPKLVVFQ